MTADTKLLAAQAQIKVLREAGERCRKEMERRGLLGEANFILREMGIPDDTAELDALVQQAKEALDSMDDFARMAGIDPIGPLKVLEDFIDSVAGRTKP